MFDGQRAFIASSPESASGRVQSITTFGDFRGACWLRKAGVGQDRPVASCDGKQSVNVCVSRYEALSSLTRGWDIIAAKMTGSCVGLTR